MKASTMQTKLTKNIHTNIYVSAALAMDISIDIIDSQFSLVELTNNKHSIIIHNASLGINLTSGLRISTNKYLTFITLQRHSIPIPKFKLLKSSNNFSIKETNSIEFPIVLKPLNESGGNDVFVGIRNKEEEQTAIDYLKKYDFILVEELIIGKNYRALLLDGEVIDIIERTQSSIMGNGIQNIKELIEEKNIERTNAKLSKIEIDDDLIRTIQRQHLNLSSIPTIGQNIYLRLVSNLQKGGSINKVPLEQVHTDNLELFAKVQNAIGLRFCGIDFITPDISTSYLSLKSAINEVNSAPGIRKHSTGDNDSIDLNVAKKVLAKLFNL